MDRETIERAINVRRSDGIFFCEYYDLKIKSREIAAGERYYK